MVEKKLMIEITGALVLLALLVGGFFKLFYMICEKDVEGNLNCDVSRLIQRKSVLQLAVECSHYRCTEGCKSSKVKGIYTKDFKCSEYCDERWQDEKGKICGSNARQYPIELQDYQLKNEFSKDDFKLFDCIFQRDSMDVDFLTGLKIVKLPYPNILIINRDLLDELETETCLISLTSFSGAVKSFKIKDLPRTLYISSETIRAVFGAQITYLWDSPSYYVFEPNKEKEIELSDKKPHRIVVKENDKIISDAVLQVEEWDKYGCSLTPSVKIIFECNGNQEEVEFCADDEKILCNNKYRIHFVSGIRDAIGLGMKGVIFRIEYSSQ